MLGTGRGVKPRGRMFVDCPGKVEDECPMSIVQTRWRMYVHCQGKEEDECSLSRKGVGCLSIVKARRRMFVHCPGNEEDVCTLSRQGGGCMSIVQAWMRIYFHSLGRRGYDIAMRWRRNIHCQCKEMAAICPCQGEGKWWMSRQGGEGMSMPRQAKKDVCPGNKMKEASPTTDMGSGIVQRRHKFCFGWLQWYS